MSFFFLLMKVRRESHLLFCDNLSLSPLIASAPLILIVLHNCVMWTLWSLKYCPYAFIITWCLELLLIFLSALLCISCFTIKGNSLSVVILKDFSRACFSEKLSWQRCNIFMNSVRHNTCWQYISCSTGLTISLVFRTSTDFFRIIRNNIRSDSSGKKTWKNSEVETPFLTVCQEGNTQDCSVCQHLNKRIQMWFNSMLNTSLKIDIPIKKLHKPPTHVGFLYFILFIYFTHSLR